MKMQVVSARHLGALVVVLGLGSACSGNTGTDDTSSSSSSSGGRASSFIMPGSSSAAGSGGASSSTGGGSSSRASSTMGGTSNPATSTPASSVMGTSSSVANSSVGVSSSRPSSSAGGSSGVVVSSSVMGNSSSAVALSSSVMGNSSSAVVVSSSVMGNSSSAVVVSSSVMGNSSSAVVASSSVMGNSSSAVVASSSVGTSSSGAVCGNGVPEAGEECDLGAALNADTGVCTRGCRNAVCGDRFIRVGTEQCDDGNANAGDGCNACQAELGQYIEIESNNTTGLADSMTQFQTRFGVIGTVGDVDYYILIPAVTTHVRIETLGPDAAPCTLGATDTNLEFLAADGTTVLASNDDAVPGTNYCSLLDPDVTPAQLAVTAGTTYYIRVTELGNNALISNYRVRVSLREITGDNNTFAAVSALNAYAPMVVGDISPAGDVDVLGFDFAQVGDVVIWASSASQLVTDCPADLTMRLLNSAGVELAYMDDGALGQTCPTMDARLDPDGPNRIANYVVRGVGPRQRAGVLSSARYYVQMAALFPGSTADNYFVRWAYTSVCGDGVVSGSETCESAGVETAVCTRACEEVLTELESNNTINLADPINTRQVRTGAIGIIGDVDVYRFNVPATTARYQAWTTEPTGDFAASCTGRDTVLELLDSAGTVLLTNDDTGGTSCSFLDTGVLAAGTYYLRVREFADNALIAGYQLHLDYAH